MARMVMMMVLCVMVVVAPYAAAVTCSQVVVKLAKCVPYLKNGGIPSSDCCSGVKGLKDAASTPADRRTICDCLKSNSGGFNPGYASSLPSKCGVSIPYKISPGTDCSKIG